jgi:hypothetical protein
VYELALEVQAVFRLSKANWFFVVIVLLLFSVLILGYINESQQSQARNNVKSLVLDAANAIKNEGESAFPDFRQGNSIWFHDQIYIFVWRTDGIRVVYPPDVNGEGENMSSLIDVNGKAIGRMFIDIASRQNGEGWIEYSWPKPGGNTTLTKETFIKGVNFGNQTYLVGSGLYVESFEDALVIPLQYIAIMLEGTIAIIGLFLAIGKKKIFGYGIFLTFAIYVFYDLARLVPIEISNSTLYPIFFVATLSILWAVIMLYREAHGNTRINNEIRGSLSRERITVSLLFTPKL